MAVRITRDDKTAGDLRRLAAASQDAKAARRMLAIALVLDGKDRKTAAESCGMDRQTLRDWVHRYNATGIDGLLNCRPPGRRRLLSSDQKKLLAEMVNTGPNLETDGVVRWRLVDLKRKIKERFNIVMHERTVGKQLAGLGFRRLSIRPQHPKTDPEAQDAFKKTSPQR
jgi:transposase